MNTLTLAYNTDNKWVETVLNDFDSFLQDHADCERKASAMAMSFVAKCPDKTEIIPDLIETALEELVHFKQVYEIMENRGVTLKKEMPQDPYINELLKHLRSSTQERLLDRMIMASLVECRGAERFKLIAENIEDAHLAKFYTILYKSEEKHGDIFLELAKKYWPENEINKRLTDFIKIEADICKKLPLRAALH
jgi:tRNA-(ms[2]io[6]A)-hydroxylase